LAYFEATQAIWPPAVTTDREIVRAAGAGGSESDRHVSDECD
jgi:hypothetical protein